MKLSFNNNCFIYNNNNNNNNNFIEKVYIFYIKGQIQIFKVGYIKPNQAPANIPFNEQHYI